MSVSFLEGRAQPKRRLSCAPIAPLAQRFCVAQIVVGSVHPDGENDLVVVRLGGRRGGDSERDDEDEGRDGEQLDGFHDAISLRSVARPIIPPGARDRNPQLYARAVNAPAQRGPRLRELGLRIGRFETGAANAITDVAGVAVGHVTVWRDEPEPPEGRGVARTGVTAVLPPMHLALRDSIAKGQRIEKYFVEGV